VETVKRLVGNISRFDFQQVSEKLPRVDLYDLQPFLEMALTLHKRRFRSEKGRISFLTPEAWLKDPMVKDEYRDLHFDRLSRDPEASRKLLGIGHRVLSQALDQAVGMEACVASLPGDILYHAIFCFRVTDRVTGQEGVPRAVIVGV
jgi:hypothetical protein